VVHRDLKPSNILIMGKGPEHGRVKIADFGMARLFQQPLRALHYDGVVVTVWYRAPELLLGAKHYSKAIDMWAIGCIFGELLTNSPLFQGKEDKQPKALQRDQLEKIFKVVGPPSANHWKDIENLPEWPRVTGLLSGFKEDKDTLKDTIPALKNNANAAALDLLKQFFHYDPSKRITATDAMNHDYFQKSTPFPLDNVFLSQDSQQTMDSSYYGPRNLHPVGMNGQAMPHMNQQSSSRGGVNQNMTGAGQKRAAPHQGHHQTKMGRK